MLERMTYLCGLAVAVISWGIKLLIGDLTDVPVLYTYTAAVGSAHDAELFEVRNLSRSKPIPSFTISALPSAGNCFTDDDIRPGGTQWTTKAAPTSGDTNVPRLMPGSEMMVVVKHDRGCNVRFGLGFADDANSTVRVVTGGIESFFLGHWLLILLCLVSAGGLTFALAFSVSLYKAWKS